MKTIIFVQNAVFVGNNHGQLIIEAAKFAAKQGSVPQYTGCAIDKEVLELYVEFSKVPEQLLNPIKVEEVDLDLQNPNADIEMPPINEAIDTEKDGTCFSIASAIKSYIPADEMRYVELSDLISLGITRLKILSKIMDSSMPFLMRRILANIVKNPSRIGQYTSDLGGNEHSLCALIYCIEWVTSNEKYTFWSKIHSILRSSALTSTEKYSKIKAVVAEFEMKN